MYPPAARLEFFLKPPLSAPLETTSVAFVEMLVHQLQDDHFAVGHSSRFSVAQVSSTGAFVQARVAVLCTLRVATV